MQLMLSLVKLFQTPWMCKHVPGRELGNRSDLSCLVPQKHSCQCPWLYPHHHVMHVHVADWENRQPPEPEPCLKALHGLVARWAVQSLKPAPTVCAGLRNEQAGTDVGVCVCVGCEDVDII